MLEVIERIPLKDTTINSAMAYESYGDYYALFVGNYMGHSIYRSLIHFSLPILSGQGAVEKVELFLYIIRNEDGSSQKKYELYRVTEKFDEYRVNYGNQPSYENEVYSEFTIGEEINTYIKVDITKLFSEWYSEKYPNYGLLIKAVDEKNSGLVGFNSKDAKDSTHSPKLCINFDRHMKAKEINHRENLEKEKMDFEKNYILGNDAYEAGDYHRAYEYYNKSLDKDIFRTAFIPKLFLRRVQTAEILGKEAEALEIIEQGLKYYPKFTDLVFLKGAMLYKQGKISLSIKAFLQCISMGESPLQMNTLTGVGSYKSYYELARIYYELQDDEEAYKFAEKSFHSSFKYLEPLYMIAKILFEKEKELEDIETKLQEYLGTTLDEKDFVTLGDVFFKQERYDTAYEYYSKIDKFVLYNPKISYGKGMCQLYLKQYHRAYECYEEIREGELYEEAVFMRVLCEILSSKMNHATHLLNVLRNPENNYRRMVFYALRDILEERDVLPFSSDRKDSEKFIDIIFDLLAILLRAASPTVFEKSLELLNLIEHDEVLLRLAKLFYQHSLYKLAYGEFIRSIQIFNRIDPEGLSMMKKALENIK
ncbi:DNRLRE domain-containing protein [Anaerosolibacter sp.]|uniref:DNRLRE domain-containing protein n=1 Tax=Anaerosolibacter sp. TaxID=1872527 RepID=UPI0039F0BA72